MTIIVEKETVTYEKEHRTYVCDSCGKKSKDGMYSCQGCDKKHYCEDCHQEHMKPMPKEEQEGDPELYPKYCENCIEVGGEFLEQLSYHQMMVEKLWSHFFFLVRD